MTVCEGVDGGGFWRSRFCVTCIEIVTIEQRMGEHEFPYGFVPWIHADPLQALAQVREMEEREKERRRESAQFAARVAARRADKLDK